jgi:hypothetical protein
MATVEALPCRGRRDGYPPSPGLAGGARATHRHPGEPRMRQGRGKPVSAGSVRPRPTRSWRTAVGGLRGSRTRHEVLGDVDPHRSTDGHAELSAALATNGRGLLMSDLVRAAYFGNRDRANRALGDAGRVGPSTRTGPEGREGEGCCSPGQAIEGLVSGDPTVASKAVTSHG